MGRTLFDPDELVRKNGGKPTMSMSQVEKAAHQINDANPDKPLDAPTTIPGPWEKDRMDLSSLDHKVAEAQPDLNADHRTASDKQYTDIMGPKHDFGVPTLEEIGIAPSQVTTPHRGGESVALETLAGYIQDDEYVGTFEKPQTSPAAFEPQSTTLLSPHLHFGSLSVRKFWWDVQEDMAKRQHAKKPTATIPTNLPGQLLFRDMYFAAQAAVGDAFARTHGNKIVRVIDWHLPSKPPGTAVDGVSHARDYEIDSPAAEEWFQRWKAGRTGFPWIDALMRQLRQEGWIHHLGRHSVACFLTRGGCYVSWERGAEVFEELLIDHETACNVGNWMWLSCTAFFAQFYRCYSPVAFGKKWDPEGAFVRRYVPELAQFDKKYIYEPWKAPAGEQEKWGCRITGDGSAEKSAGVYPAPMFDFDERRKICLDGMKHAYDVGMHGDDPRVLDGSWAVVFGEEDDRPPKKKPKTETA
ncbi:hypothetical protein N7462_010567 [Penicillium macrosclerotiorum]|uniref:uncharacterized protein n=1 Tax=Penicillium macrosclerotiorum TaxID=303699 RepID=UPI002549790A|nr:uncharacterized protein N7462_010567 [Penicillium macrosclerotiorum]KAJ5669497.1 hypothetical protein N7462_010567 [Penicillium macrosclerotiorum]